MDEYALNKIETIIAKARELKRMSKAEQVLKADEYAEGITVVAGLIIDHHRKSSKADMILRLDNWMAS